MSLIDLDVETPAGTYSLRNVRTTKMSPVERRLYDAYMELMASDVVIAADNGPAADHPAAASEPATQPLRAVSGGKDTPSTPKADGAGEAPRGRRAGASR